MFKCQALKDGGDQEKKNVEKRNRGEDKVGWEERGNRVNG